MQRISVWAHVLEKAEETMTDVSCMIASLSQQCGDVAYHADDTIDPAEKEKRAEAAVELLYDARIRLRLLSSNLEHQARHLESIRKEAQEKAGPVLKAA